VTTQDPQKDRRPAEAEAATQQTGESPTDTITPPRRPCRICRRRTRPLVPIGSSHGWDMCWCCFRGVSNPERHSAEPAVEAWQLRVAEVLADAESVIA
jgi:hypothetical protein